MTPAFISRRVAALQHSGAALNCETTYVFNGLALLRIATGTWLFSLVNGQYECFQQPALALHELGCTK